MSAYDRPAGSCSHCARFHPPGNACARDTSTTPDGVSIWRDEADEWPTSRVHIVPSRSHGKTAAHIERMAGWVADAPSDLRTMEPSTTNAGGPPAPQLNRAQRRAAASRRAKR
jgi:hypothetical protein